MIMGYVASELTMFLLFMLLLLSLSLKWAGYGAP